MKDKSISKIIISRTISFLIFLILLAIATFLVPAINNYIYSQIINFLLRNISLSVIIFFISLIADIFWNIPFPLNLPAPIISAITYIYRLWLLIESIINMQVLLPIIPIYVLIFWLVIIFGYLRIFLNLLRKESAKEKMKKTEKVEWHDIGQEFKLALYKIGKALNDALSPKKKK